MSSAEPLPRIVMRGSTMVVLLWAISVFSYAPSALSAQGVLELSPERSVSGDTIQVIYRTDGALAGEPELHLRARTRTRLNPSYNTGLGSTTLADMHRQSDGEFRGSFVLPDEYVYAALAVEDADGELIDSREGRFWELLIHDAGGRPLFAALEQRFNDHMGRDEQATLATAKEMVRLYPDLVQSWTMLHAAQGWVLGESGVETRLADHRERLRKFDAAFREGDRGADEIAYLYWYAYVLDDESRSEYWLDRLLAHHPTHFFSVQERLMAIRRAHQDDTAGMLIELETLWNEADSDLARERMVGSAFNVARETAGAEEILRWADRYAALDPQAVSRIASALADLAVTRGVGLERLREEIEAIDQASDEDRDLGATRSEQQAYAILRAAWLRADLGSALLDAGYTAEGIAALERAADVGWSTGRFRALGEAQLSTWDTAAAVVALAAVAADPGTRAAASDSLRASVALDSTSWRSAVAVATEQMYARTLAFAVNKEIEFGRLVTPAGEVVELEEVIGEEATIIVFWSRYCPYSVRAMPRIQTLTQQFGDEGVPFLAITRDPPTAAEIYLQDEGLEVRALYDTRGEAARALNTWGTPQYFVLDGAGRVRFEFTSLDALERQVASLVN